MTRQRLSSIFFSDPRHYQIFVLSTLLIYGVWKLDFQIPIVRIPLVLLSILFIQWLFCKLFKISIYEPRSVFISGLSLCLLFRTHSWLLVFTAVFFTVSSKFFIRIKQKHIFNPTNFGIVLLLILSDQVWVSPSQWGSVTFFAFLMACLGGMVVYRAKRTDVSIAFILIYCLLIFGRSYLIGEPWTIPIHRLQSGALLLFTFFMISDPKTTPNSRTGRIFFAFLVALGAYYVQFKLFRTNGLLWSLFFCSALVPLIDRFLPDTQYRWSQFSSEQSQAI